MRVFVAGGSGAIGRRLLPQLVAAGHEVTATTRRPENKTLLARLGATPMLCDALDREAVVAAVRASRAEVVMNQLTELPQRYEPRKIGPWYEKTSLLRVHGTRHLLEGAHAAGARRFVYQSIAFMYRLSGPRVLDEEAPVATDAPEPFGATVRATLEGERLTLETEGIEGVVLRYGQLYGPGTYFHSQGHLAQEARRRRLPVVGQGEGLSSFLHVDDAGGAGLRALDRGVGVYNVVDDEPAAAREWIPAFCAAVGAPGPLHVPGWLAGLLVGSYVRMTLEHGRGASNQKAASELGWRPTLPSWREGFKARD
ncbi:MAG: NAD(P)-dependent oxidoreductase [Candidatus Dormibacteraeota bacterium]|nr:NAD(P)-dependent oxidoreductase [Candidatus Dormibacteraeota bacterium]